MLYSVLPCAAVCCQMLPCPAVSCRVLGSPKSLKHLYLAVDVWAGWLLQSCGYVRATFGSALAGGACPGFWCFRCTCLRLQFIELGFTCGCKMCGNKDSTNMNCDATTGHQTRQKYRGRRLGLESSSNPKTKKIIHQSQRTFCCATYKRVSHRTMKARSPYWLALESWQPYFSQFSSAWSWRFRLKRVCWATFWVYPFPALTSAVISLVTRILSKSAVKVLP